MINYFKNVHKIPESFNLKYAPHTAFKEMIVRESQTDYERELERMIEGKQLESFWWDVVNTEKVYSDLTYWRVDDRRSYSSPFRDKEIKPKQINNALNRLGAKP